MITDPKQIIIETMSKAGEPLTDDQQLLLAGSMSVIARIIEQRVISLLVDEEFLQCPRTIHGSGAHQSAKQCIERGNCGCVFGGGTTC